MPIAVGSSIATVAVLDTNADSSAVIAPNARITPVVDPPTPLRDRIRNANRRARPCLSIAWARMNAPMNVKIVDDPNGPRTSSTGATPRKTAIATPSRPPIGMGTASLIHSVITPSSTAASTCCSRGMSSGTTRNSTVISGARNRPMVRLPFSNRSSWGDSFCSPRLRYVADPRSALSTSVGLTWFSAVMRQAPSTVACVLDHTPMDAELPFVSRT